VSSTRLSDPHGDGGGVSPAAHFFAALATEYQKIMIDIQ